MCRKSTLVLAAAAILCSGTMMAIHGQSRSIGSPRSTDLKRQAFLGVHLRSPSSSTAGAEVTRITDATVAGKYGLRVGDRILRLNGTLLDGPIVFQRTLPSLRADETARLEIVRDGQLIHLSPTLVPFPREQLKGVETIYDAALTDLGFRVRMIVTRPQNVSGKIPAVLLVGWLSCDSVEYPLGPGEDGFGQLLHDVATQSGAVLIRVDKPGIGDSEGPACVDSDFQAELAGYRAALRALKRYDFVDPDRIFILGLSNGGGFAPLVAQSEPVRGYVVAGAWSKTWFEHMVELERRRLILEGKAPGEVAGLMGGYAELHTDFLIRKMKPLEIARSKPHLASLWYDDPDHLYGLPAAFYQQLQDLNLLSAWEKVQAPVLVLRGEYDWIMSREDSELIVDVVNKKSAGKANYIELPKTSHLFGIYDNLGAAFRGDSPWRYNTSVTAQVVKFIQTNR